MLFIATGPLFTIRGTAGSCAWIAPNCLHYLEFLVGTLASLLCLVSCAEGLVLHCICNEEFKKALAKVQRD